MISKGIKIKETIKQHIKNNKKEYIIVSLLFIIGIFLGVLFVNNMQDDKKVEANSYLSSFIENMKVTENLDNINLLKNSIWQNTILALTIWFFGTTVIRDTDSFPVLFYIEDFA